MSKKIERGILRKSNKIEKGILRKKSFVGLKLGLKTSYKFILIKTRSKQQGYEIRKFFF